MNPNAIAIVAVVVIVGLLASWTLNHIGLLPIVIGLAAGYYFFYHKKQQ